MKKVAFRCTGVMLVYAFACAILLMLSVEVRDSDPEALYLAMQVMIFISFLLIIYVGNVVLGLITYVPDASVAENIIGDG